MKISSALLVAGLFACIWQGAVAQEGLRHPLTDPPPPADSVETEVWFPKHLQNQLQFTVGEPVDVIVGFHNGGNERLNITGMLGSINLSEQPSFFVQNFTGKGYDASLAAGEEVSLGYSFTPAAGLPQREFQLSLVVFYQSQTAPYSSLVFNRTVDLMEQPSWIDTELLFLWLLLLAVLGVGGFFAYRYISNLPYVKKARKQPRKTDVAKGPRQVNQDEWLKGTHHDLHQRAKAKRAASMTKAPSAPTPPS